MVKILRIITRLNVGGPAIHTILLNSELNKGDYKDTLVCGVISDSEGDMSYLAQERGINPIVVPELTRDISLARDFRALLKLYSIIKAERPDIIHTHTAKAGTLGRVAAIAAGVPVKIHTFHGHIFDGYFSSAKAITFLWIERILALFTNRVITVSDRVRDDIVGRLRVAKESKSAVIPLGFELDKFFECDSKRGIFRKRFGIAKDTILIGIVGRLVPIKNHHLFIEAARAILRKRTSDNIKFVVVGDGELRRVLQKKVEDSGISHNFLFTGWIDDLVSVYADLDIVVLTSLNEGTPVSIIEAMASAKPVVATSVGGVMDLVDDSVNGYLVKSGDAAGLEEKIAVLIDNREMRHRIGSKGRESVGSKYSKDRLVGDIKLLYKGCIEEDRLGLCKRTGRDD